MPNDSKNGDHIVRSFDDELANLSILISRMGGLAESQLASAMTAVVQRDSNLAERVIEHDSNLDDLDAEVDIKATNLLALRQPMAVYFRGSETDVLRIVVAIVERARARAERLRPRPSNREEFRDVSSRLRRGVFLIEVLLPTKGDQGFVRELLRVADASYRDGRDLLPPKTIWRTIAEAFPLDYVRHLKRVARDKDHEFAPQAAKLLIKLRSADAFLAAARTRNAKSILAAIETLDAAELGANERAALYHNEAVARLIAHADPDLRRALPEFVPSYHQVASLAPYYLQLIGREDARVDEIRALASPWALDALPELARLWSVADPGSEWRAAIDAVVQRQFP